MEGIKAESRLITEELKGQILGVFEKLEKKVVLTGIVDADDEKGRELGELLLVLGSLHPLVTADLYEPGSKKELEELFDPQMRPVCGLFLENGEYTGAAFYGVPGGQELNSLIFAIYNAGSAGQPIEKRLLKKLEKVTKPVHLRTFVSLACHHCPKMVITCQRLCMLSPYISADMVDASLYPQMQEKYKLERVPVTIVNEEERLMGVKTVETIVEIVCDKGSEKKKWFS